MDLMSMLPLLMAMNGGKNSSGGPDMQTMLKLLSMLNGNTASPADAFGALFNKTDTTPRKSPREPEPANPDMHDISGMLSPEMIKLLMHLAVR